MYHAVNAFYKYILTQLCVDNEFKAVYNLFEVKSLDTLGSRLKYARKSKGFTQDSLANSIGVSRGVIFNLEKDKTEPQAIVVNAICQTLNVNKDWLRSGSGEMENTSKISRNARALAELCDVVRELSEDEQLYLLDTIKALKTHLNSEKNG